VSTSAETILEIDNLSAGYGRQQVLWGVSMTVGKGEIVAVLGPNGAGKSTLLNTISGQVRVSGGFVRHAGTEITSLRPDRVVRRGIVQVPQGRRIFGALTVEQNLVLGAFTVRDGSRITTVRDRVYDLFPDLAAKRHLAGGGLSGGQQQMLAIGRALMSEPTVLLMDEPSAGLAPLLVERLTQTTRELAENLDMTILLVEQSATLALAAASRAYVLHAGRVVMHESADDLRQSDRLAELIF